MRRCQRKNYLALLMSTVFIMAGSGCAIDGYEDVVHEDVAYEDVAYEDVVYEDVAYEDAAYEIDSLCPEDMTEYRGQNGFQLQCICPSTAAASGWVWGTDTYTDDSSLCRAAVHAGAIPLSGGHIVATVKPGQSSYASSVRNGVTSYSWGSWIGSYSVRAATYAPACPSNLTSYRGRNGTEVFCHCSSSAAASGSVWGTDTYTDDSSLCRAAVHAGAIPLSGGHIVATVKPGQSSYASSVRNGVTSYSWGSWVGSYSVRAGGDAQACPANLTSYRGRNGTEVFCHCSSSAAASGSVWGTDTYTDDSSLCRAAVHAGAIPLSGGHIVATVKPGQSSYVSSVRNGVTSYSWGSWVGSYSVRAGTYAPLCPTNLMSYRGWNGTEVSCHCSSSAAASGSVYGTDTYTDDSKLCRAAVHAGAIPLSGGHIVATVKPGQSSYVSSARNGVTSYSWGSWVGSYSVRAGAYLPPCSANLTSYRGRNGTDVFCRCSSSATASGSVWGTDMYTDDSSLCRAAVHAGVVPLVGGIIHAVIYPGVSNYAGSTRNGVTSFYYGSWIGSYFFP